MTFAELNLNAELLEGLEAMGFEKATPIQEKAIPAILEGKDLIACAQTGTGKTAAFLLPMLHDLSENPGNATVNTLIIVPTRELAVQIDQQLEGFAYFTGLSSLAIYGGQDSDAFIQEKKALTQGVDVVVATPGRLIAHLNLGYVRFEKLKCLILDEADRMLDMGFLPDITKITSSLPKKRQNLMFSATMPPKIKKFAKTILNDPVSITIAVSKPAKGVSQAVYHVETYQKLDLLKYLLNPMKGKENRVLIFSSRKSSVKEISHALKRNGLRAGEIHSDLQQDERESTLRNYKNGSIHILVATDILSRGIDVKDIQLVFNYDLPGDAEDYIHRVGRTARADAKGMAITFVTRREQRKMDNIEKLMEMKVSKFDLPASLKNSDSRPPRSDKRSHKPKRKKNVRKKKNKSSSSMGKRA